MDSSSTPEKKTPQTFSIPEQENGSRLDHFLKRALPHLPYGLLAKLARKGALKLNGKKVSLSQRVESGQILSIPQTGQKEGQNTSKTPQNDQKRGQNTLKTRQKIDFKAHILHEESSFLAFDKPTGLATQGGSKQKTSLDALACAYYEEQGISPHLVHRLDKETSGLILIAKTLEMAKKLTHSFKEHLIQKTYVAVAHGTLEKETGTINAPLLIQENKTRKVIVSPEGKPALTQYKVLRSCNGVSLLSLSPKTGRMHQLRVHLAHIGHPILGDDKYGTARADWQNNPTFKKRLYLHAEKLVLPSALSPKKELISKIPATLLTPIEV